MFSSKKYSSHNLLSSKCRNKRRVGSSRRRRKKNKKKFELIPLVTAKKGFVASRKKGLLDYKNVILLRQFLTIKGTILPRAKTRLTANEQRKVARTIKTARILGLLPFVRR